jgi:LmbE family N-acetylglucosaminyl deacetylase
MAIGSHADDIESCVGGTLLKYRAAGYEVVYVLSTNNFSGNWATIKPDGKINYATPTPAVIEPQRKKEAAAAAAFFGTKPIHLDHPQRHYFREDGTQAELRYGCPLPEGVKPDVPSILTAYEHKPSVTALAQIILQHDPEAVITHSPVMVNIEHYATTMLTVKAYWKAVKGGYQGMLLLWHDITVGPYGDAYSRWDTFIDVSEFWDIKFQAIGLHACQIPRPSDLELPPWGPACGCRYAEVFDIVSTGKRPPQGAPFNTEILHHRR